jgi:predicted ATPase/class 3 adenylate cyclase
MRRRPPDATVQDAPITTFLFTDIEGSTRLWEGQPDAMREALARHDGAARRVVEEHGGSVVKMTGDGVHAAFIDPSHALAAAIALQDEIGAIAAAIGLDLRVRCGLHAGAEAMRDNDYFGASVNRAARIMSVAHGGQVLLSQVVAALAADRLPQGATVRDLGLVRLRDLSRPEQVFQLLHPKLRADFPALRSLESAPNNLPHEMTSFVGRARDVAGVRALVGRNRLTTITGMGGLGKTRLARHVGAEMLDDFPDGTWLIELGEITDARLVPQAVASVLQVQEEAGREVIDGLARHLRDRKALIVLDNCEHLLEACATLAKRLLAAASAVKILATSREPLHLAGESAYILPALDVPDLRAPFEPAVLMRNEAARLFVERALAARSDFTLTLENSAQLAAICHRLDGIPLALELAAARVRTLSLSALAERLSDRFKLLRAGDRTASPRQQTLQALIDWSYGLLDGPERALMRELSVFAGGWTLEAAEAVCRCDDVLDLLARLVEKSLAVHDADSGRYRMLDTVRQYARERLEESGLQADVRARHFTYFRERVQSTQTALAGADVSQALATLEADFDNIVAALTFAGAAPETRLQLANDMKRYWLHRGLLQAGLQLTLDALANAAMAPSSQRNRAMFTVGQLHYLMGRYAQARQYLTETLDHARQLGDVAAIPALLQSLGMAAQGEGDRSGARRYLEEALGIARQGRDKRRIAAAMNALAQLELAAGNMPAAASLLEDVVQLSTEASDVETIAIGLLNLAIVSISRNAPQEACVLLRRILPIAATLRSMRIEQSLLEVCAGLAAANDDLRRAARFYGASECQAGKMGLRRNPADEAFLAPLVQRARQHLGETRFEEEARAGAQLPAPEVVEEVRAWLLSSPG